MKYFFLIVTSIFLELSCFAQHDLKIHHLTVGSLERQYLLHLPQKYDSIKKYPLIFVLHGGGGSATRMEKFVGAGFNSLADRENFVVVYPNGFEKGWNDGSRDTLAAARRMNIDDVAFFDAMIEEIAQNVSINREQIFACGISNGGFMVQRLAFERSAIFKGVAAVAASLSEAQSREQPPQNPVPILFICGTSDPLVPYWGGPVTVLKQKRGMVKSMDETISFWKEVNVCTQCDEEYRFPDRNKRDESTAVRTNWFNQAHAERTVTLIKVENGGHTWPGARQYLPKSMVGTVNRDFDASEEIWVFFKKQIEKGNKN